MRGWRYWILGVSLIFCVPGIAFSQGDTLDMAILLDRSGSMRKSDPAGLSIPAALFLLDQAELASEQNRSCVVLFDTEVKTLPKAGLTSNFHELRTAMEKMTGPEGLTEMEGALSTTLQLFAGSKAHEKEVVLVTDGVPMPNPENAGRYPDPKQQKIVEQYRKAIGSASQKERSTVEVNYAGKLSLASKENIVKTLLPSFKSKEISVYPVGLTTEVDAGLLKEIALRTTSNAESFTIVSRAADLVPALSRLVPLPQTVLRLFDSGNAGDKIAGREQWEVEVPVSVSASTLRFMVVFPAPGPDADQVRFVLKDPSGQTVSPDAGAASAYLAATDREKHKVFERYFINKPQGGTWRIHLSSASGTKLLPNLLVMVDARTDLRLKIDANPAESAPGSAVRLRAVLEDGQGNRSPLDRVEAHIRHGSGQAYSVTLQSTQSGGVLEGLFQVPQSAPLGDYTVQATGYRGKSGSITGKGRLKIVPPSPASLFVQIPYGVSKPGEPITSSIEKEKIAFQPMGDKVQEAVVQNIQVTTDSQTDVSLSIEILSPEDKEGRLLDARRWIKLSNKEGSVREGRPFTFSLTARFPPTIPDELQSGRFEGIVRIESPQAKERMEIPIAVNLSIPELTAVGFDPKTGLAMCIRCSKPGSAKAKLEVKSTSLIDQPVRIVIPPFLMSEAGDPVPAERLSLNLVVPSETETTVKAKGEETPMIVRAAVNDKELAPGSYHGTILLDGLNMRDLTVPVHIQIPEKTLSAYIRQGGLVWCALSLFFLAFFIWRYRAHRDRFQGYRTQWHLTDLSDSGRRFNRYFSLRASDNQVKVIGIRDIRYNGREVHPSGQVLQRTGEIRAGRLTVQVSTNPQLVTITVMRGEFSRSSHTASIILAVVALAVGVLALCRPELLCYFL